MPKGNLRTFFKSFKDYEKQLATYPIDHSAREADFVKKHSDYTRPFRERIHSDREWLENLRHIEKEYPEQLSDPINAYLAYLEEWKKLEQTFLDHFCIVDNPHQFGIDMLSNLHTHETIDSLEARMQLQIGRAKNMKAIERHHELKTLFDTKTRKLTEELTPYLEDKIKKVIDNNNRIITDAEQTIEEKQTKIVEYDRIIEDEERKTEDLERRVAEYREILEGVTKQMIKDFDEKATQEENELLE